jgi:hypothetical protein
MNTADISLWGMGFAYAAVLGSVLIFRMLRLPLTRWIGHIIGVLRLRYSAWRRKTRMICPIHTDPGGACVRGPDRVHRYRVLYGPDGRPAVLQGTASDGSVIRSLELQP